MSRVSLREADLPPDGRFLVIGDIHGHLDLLTAVLRRAGYDARRDKIVSLGDVIDRGPDSPGCIQFLRDANAIVLLGNHEAMMLAAWRDVAAWMIWQREGGHWADIDTAKALRPWAESLPLSAELRLKDGRHIGLVHAEVAGGTDWEESRELSHSDLDLLDDQGTTLWSRMIWGRTAFKLAMWGRAARKPEAFQIRGLDLLIAGHSIVPTGEPLCVGDFLWIDTGSYATWMEGRLTAFDPASGTYWQAGRTGKTYGPEVLP